MTSQQDKRSQTEEVWSLSQHQDYLEPDSDDKRDLRWYDAKGRGRWEFGINAELADRILADHTLAALMLEVRDFIREVGDARPSQVDNAEILESGDLCTCSDRHVEKDGDCLFCRARALLARIPEQG